jgi:hypothetical protein
MTLGPGPNLFCLNDPTVQEPVRPRVIISDLSPYPGDELKDKTAL